MRKENQKITVYVIIGLLIISLIGTSFAFLGDMRLGGLSNDYAGQVDKLKQTLEANPQDTQTRLSLANTYYDWGMRILSQDMSSEENFAISNEILQQAVGEYQEVIKTEKNVNILVDMATAATYTQQYDLAEAAFEEALQENPAFYNGLYNYGFHLFVRNDFGGAIEKWEKALALENIRDEDKKRLDRNIKMAQDAIAAEFQQTESENPSGN